MTADLDCAVLRKSVSRKESRWKIGVMRNYELTLRGLRQRPTVSYSMCTKDIQLAYKGTLWTIRTVSMATVSMKWKDGHTARATLRCLVTSPDNHTGLSGREWGRE